MAEHEAGRERGHLPQRRFRFVEASKLARHHADVAEDRVTARIVQEGVAERGERGVRLVELAERRTEIAERGGKRRHQLAGTAECIACARQVVEREPQLSELVVDRFPVGGERRGALERLTRAEILMLAIGARQRELRDGGIWRARAGLAAHSEPLGRGARAVRRGESLGDGAGD